MNKFLSKTLNTFILFIVIGHTLLKNINILGPINIYYFLWVSATALALSRTLSPTT